MQWINLPDPLQPGHYEYTDPIGTTEVVEIVDQDGVLVARFPDHDAADELVPIADMAGTFTPVAAAARTTSAA